ncbi:MAG: chlorinating enzyme [Nostoc sp.]|uniref:chlorinating enzyme n=1 Tax=Nostoc sp. TaxID=1180 RepID=UPI002FFB0FC1
MQNTQNKHRKFSLTPEQLASFHERGYAGPFTLYQPEEMKALWQRERIEILDRSKAIYQDSDAISGATNISNYDRHLDLSFLADHISRPEIVDRVSSVLGPDVLCWRSEFFPKYPGDEGTDWHQADTFANASGSPQIVWPDAEDFGGTITVWTAFTEATIENGCLQFIPGTHRTMYYDESKRMHYNQDQINTINKEAVQRGFFGYDYRQLQIDPDWKPEESKSVSMIMRPGQFILFWSTLMHASHPHSGKTKQMRLGYVARYVPTSVRIYPDTEVVTEYGGSIKLEKYGGVLVSGKNDFTHNRIVTHTTRGKAFTSNLCQE